MSSGNKSRICVIKNRPYINVGGLSFDISRIEMTLSRSSIPTIQVLVPPATRENRKQDNDSSGSFFVSNPTLSDMNSLIQQLYSFVEQDTTASIISDKGDPCIEENQYVNDSLTGTRLHYLNIKDWLLTDVTPGVINTVTGYGMSLTIQHPAVKLARAGFIPGSLKNSIQWDVKLQGKFTNPVAQLHESFQIYADAQRKSSDLIDAKSLPEGSDTKKKFDDVINSRKSFFSSEVVPMLDESKNASYSSGNKHITWQTSWPNNGGTRYTDVPVSTEIDKLAQGQLSLKKAFSYGYVSHLGDSSVWDMVVRGMCQDFSLVVVPEIYSMSGTSPNTPQVNLKIQPDSPWANPVYFLSENRISSITCSPSEFNPVIGVRVVGPTQNMKGWLSTYPDYKNQKVEDDAVSEQYFVPDGLLNRKYGRLVTMSWPSWLDSTLEFSTSGKTTKFGTYKKPQNTESPSAMNEYEKAYKAMAGAFAAGTFYSLFRAGSTVSLKLPFTQWLPGSSGDSDTGYPLTAGYVLRITTGDGNKPLIDGYIHTVRHSVDCGSSIATTEIMLTHVRPPEGIKNVVENGYYNPLWTP